MATHSKGLLPGALTTAALLAAAAAGAHHGTTMFDRGNPIIVSGVVHEFRWTSPHAWIVVDVPATPGAPPANGAAPAKGPAADPGQWSFEGGSIAVMVRNGWKSTSLRAGDRVSVVAAPRRDGTRSGEFLRITLTETGKVLQIAGQ